MSLAPPKLRFLVADPLEGVQVFSRRLLEAYGFEPALIRCVGDSAAALAAVQAEVPDFLLTDWFPRATPTGLALAQALRALRPDCQVGFLSFTLTPEIENEARALGSRFVLKKPFDAESLRRELNQAFAHLAQSQPALAARVRSESGGRLAGRVQVALPPLPPPLRAGEHVKFQGKPRRVRSVVISRGEEMAELEGVAHLVPAHQLSR